MKKTLRTVLAGSILLAVVSVANANLLLNGDFSNPGIGATASFTGLYPGPCAATDWEVFNNYYGITNTEIRTPIGTLPTGTPTSLFFASTAENSEIAQVFGGANGGHTYASAWVYLIRGNVGLGIGDGGATGYESMDTTTRQWVHLTAENTGVTNEFIVGDTGLSDGAEFYVADASVVNRGTSTPSPMAVLPFVSGLAFLRRRRRA